MIAYILKKVGASLLAPQYAEPEMLRAAACIILWNTVRGDDVCGECDYLVGGSRMRGGTLIMKRRLVCDGLRGFNEVANHVWPIWVNPKALVTGTEECSTVECVNLESHLALGPSHLSPFFYGGASDFGRVH